MSKAIVVAPSPVLGEIAKPFEFRKGDKSLALVLKQMEETLLEAHDPKGVGLAAPQIGKSLRIFIAKPTEKSKISVFINPRILTSNSSQLTTNDQKSEVRSQKRVRKLEGCLSLPNIWGEVKRSPSVVITFFDQKGKKRTKKFSGFMATIVQHEVDHLNGVLFPKRVLEQKGRLYKSHKNEKGQDEFEEIEI